MRHQLDVFRRDDDLWGWRLHGVTGQVVAMDGGEGFKDRATAAMTARELLAGELEVVVEIELPLCELVLSTNEGAHSGYQ